MEPNGIIEQAERVARGFAKRKNRGSDGAFIDEAIAEANYICTYYALTEWEAICKKYPEKEDRAKFFRCTVGYRLKGYFSYRATSTVSYLKKKGIDVQRHSIHEGMLVEYVSAFDVQVCLESVCTDAHEMRVVEFYSMGNTVEEIATKCGMSKKRVKKILIRVKRRLLTPNKD